MPTSLKGITSIEPRSTVPPNGKLSSLTCCPSHEIAFATDPCWNGMLSTSLFRLICSTHDQKSITFTQYTLLRKDILSAMDILSEVAQEMIDLRSRAYQETYPTYIASIVPKMSTCLQITTKGHQQSQLKTSFPAPALPSCTFCQTATNSIDQNSSTSSPHLTILD